MATTNNAWPIPASTDYVKDGYAAIDNLGNAIDTSVGTGLLAWQTYTPTITGWTGTTDFRWVQLGKTLIISGLFQLTSATVSGSSFLFSFPAGKTARITQSNIGSARAATSTVNGYGIVGCNSTTQGTVIVFNASGTYVTPTNLATGIPGTWASGSQISFNMIVQVV